MISKSRVDRSKFQIAFIPDGMNLLGNLLFLQSSSMGKGSSNFHQDFALSTFNDQVRIDFWEKCIKGFTSKLAIVNRAFFFGYSSFSLLLIIGASKFVKNPIHNIFISITNFNICVVVKNWIGSQFGFSMKKSYEKAPFSVDKSCKICEFCICHKAPLFKTDQYSTDPNICTA